MKENDMSAYKVQVDKQTVIVKDSLMKASEVLHLVGLDASTHSLQIKLKNGLRVKVGELEDAIDITNFDFERFETVPKEVLGD